MAGKDSDNRLYYGDNLDVLREHVADDSVDLVYLDPPFNSNASYNILFRSPAGTGADASIEAFDDTWSWGPAAAGAMMDITQGGNHKLHVLMQAMRTAIGENAMMAYLAMMAVRLQELHRVLKPTGSLYLHCDPTASHYLKLVLDAVFGAEHSGTRSCGSVPTRIMTARVGARLATSSYSTPKGERLPGTRRANHIPKNIRHPNIGMTMATDVGYIGSTT